MDEAGHSVEEQERYRRWRKAPAACCFTLLGMCALCGVPFLFPGLVAGGFADAERATGVGAGGGAGDFLRLVGAGLAISLVVTSLGAVLVRLDGQRAVQRQALLETQAALWQLYAAQYSPPVVYRAAEPAAIVLRDEY